MLTTRPEDNRYGDTPKTYTFPNRYRALFNPLDGGEEIMAVLYEPRRDQGRQSYVAWTTLWQPAAPDPSDPQLWQVRYEQNVRPFPRTVPKAVNGRDFEELLRLTPLVRHAPTLQGRSVREISAGDFLGILSQAGVIPPLVQPEVPDLALPAERERQERLIRRLARDGSFRERVLRAYDHRCAVTGIGYVHAQTFGSGQLVEGAHLRPVAAQGSDETCNGLALTPTLHRLFDAGLFTLEYAAEGLRVRPSGELRHCDLAPAGSASRLALGWAQPVRLPQQPTAWPAPEALAYHQATVFRPRWPRERSVGPAAVRLAQHQPE